MVIRFLLFCVIVFYSTQIQASLTVPVNIETMSTAADRIFMGKVISVEKGKDQTGRIHVSHIRFQVIETYKGDTGKTVLLRQVNFYGMPKYRVGEEVVVFLSKDSRKGLSSPIGLGQGVFRLMARKGDRSNVPVINESQNLGLFRSAKKIKVKEIGVRALASQVSSRPELTVRDLRNLISASLESK